MIFPDKLRLAFLILCVILSLILGFMSLLMFKKQNEYSKSIAYPIFIGIASIAAYCLFICIGPENKTLAILFDSIFFVGTDWLSLVMFMFAIDYTGITKKYKNKLFIAGATACTIDTFHLVINNYTGRFMFDLKLIESEMIGSKWWAHQLNGYFWANNFHWLHYIHLGMCYIMVGATFVYFIISAIRAPSFYKEKFNGILVAYVIVIFTNFISYSANFPIDFSVLLYPFLAGFICYYCTWAFPSKLLHLSLSEVNETISDGILYFDINGHCVYRNKVAETLFSNVKGFNESKVEQYRSSWISEVNDQIPDMISGKDTFTINGTEHHYEVFYQVEKSHNQIIGSSMRFADKTDEVINYMRERYAATHDELTGILNQSGFFEAVDKLVYEEGTVGWVMVTSNIKDFKLVNELFGEEIGDEVILNEASYLMRYTTDDTVFGRISDDKFALYARLHNFNEEKIDHFISKLQNLADSNVYQMKIRVGIYKPLGRAEKAQVMYDKAAMALTQITGNYNKVFAYYNSELMEQLIYEKKIAENFQNAVSTNQIKMYLQPIIDVGSNTFGAEALCRWEHPEHGLMYPGQFLSILEKNGLIYQLDEYIWESAAKKLHEWNEKGCNDVFISVNISVKDFFYTDIYKTFTRLVETYDINPSSLHIEITESILMSDFEKAFVLANKLQKFGFCISIDNFGNGYSSLNMLKDFTAGSLKVDMALLKNASIRERDQIILETTINMAKELNMKVIGEGVENKEQYDLLSKFKCQILQGNYISTPLEIEDFENKFVNFFTTK